MNRISNIDNTLRVKGLRATAQRLLICKEIDKAGHIDIDTLYDRLKKQIPSLSLATIYKNMHALVDKDIISEVNVSGKKTLYEINFDTHIHFICSKCGKIEDIEYNTENLVEGISELKGKNVTGCNINITGICDSCAK